MIGALPPRLKSLKPLPKKVRDAAAPQPASARFVASHVPTADQAQAIERIGGALGRFQTFLLHGITGSGKTEVYLRLIARVLENGNQALVLVPEISLTPQLESRFRHAFPQAHIVLLHSALQYVAAHRACLAAARCEPACAGTRLAPTRCLGSPGRVARSTTSFKHRSPALFARVLP